MKTNIQKKINRKLRYDLMSKVSIFSFSLVAIIVLLVMFFMILQAAFPAYSHYGFFHMYFTANFTEAGGWGIWGGLIVTLFTSIVAVIIATPLAIRTSIFITFRIKYGKKFFSIFINILAGVPSVIFGVFALNAFSNISKTIIGLDTSVTILNASLILTLMIFPTLVALITNQLMALDPKLINSSIALGNSKTHSIYKVAKKVIRSGIFVAIITALGRAIGETMALSMLLTNSPSPTPFANGINAFLKSGFGSLGVEIAKNFYTDSADPNVRSALFGAGIALFVIIMLLVISATKISQKKRLINQNPLKVNETINKDKFPINFLYLIAIIWHWLWIPFRILRFATVYLLEYLARLKEIAAPWILYPLYLLIFPRNRVKTNREYYGFVKKSWKNKIPDLYRYMWEIISASIILGSTIWITLTIMINGVPGWTKERWAFVTTETSDITGLSILTPGIIGNTIVFTFILIIITLFLSFPFALGTALFLSEYAGADTKLGKIIRFFLDSLGGTPSIIFGIFGVLLFRTVFNIAGGRLSVIAAALTMVLVVIPTFTRSIEQTLITIPDAYRQASYALGASKFETIRKVILPQAIPGIASGIVLSAGRIISETAPIYLLIGMLGNIKVDLMDQGWTMTTKILYNQVYATGNTIKLLKESYAIAAAAIMLIACLIIFSETIPQQIKYIYKPMHLFLSKNVYRKVFYRRAKS